MQFQKERIIYVPRRDVQFQKARIIALFFKIKKKNNFMKWALRRKCYPENYSKDKITLI